MQTCTLRDLVPEGAAAGVEDDPEVARLKSSAALVRAIEPAVRMYEEPPTEGMEVETPYADLWLSAADWAEAFGAPDPGTPHNEARDQVWEELLTILVDKVDDEDVADDQLRRSLAQNRELTTAFDRAWTLLEPTDLVEDLWSVPAYLRMCAPWLEPDEVRRLQREDPRAWTVSDLPFLDAARQRLGDPEVVASPAAARRGRRRRAGADAGRGGRPGRDRRLGDARDVDAARRGRAERHRRRGRAHRRRPGPARRPVRPRRGRRGAGAHRRRVADAAAPLPVAQLHHRRGPRPGPARVHRVVAGAAGAGRARPRGPRVADDQLPHAGGGDGRGRAGDPGRDPGRQRADLGPQHRRARPARSGGGAGRRRRLLARRARRGHRLRHRRRRRPQ